MNCKFCNEPLTSVELVDGHECPEPEALGVFLCSVSREDLEKMAKMRSDFLLCFIEERSHFDAPFIEKCLNFARDCAAKHLEENKESGKNKSK